MKFKPRDYQQRCFDNVKLLFNSRVSDLPNIKIHGLSYHIDDKTDTDKKIKAVMVASPPGSGKGDLLCWMAATAYEKGGTVLIWVHRTELCNDLADRIHKKFDIPKHQIGFIMSGVKENRRCRIQIASVMTKIRRDTEWLSPNLVLTDECHRILSNSQMKLLERVSDAHLVGFTATPFRTDSKRGFQEVFDCLFQLTTYMELVEKRFLMPTRIIAPDGAAKIDGVKIRMGDYVQSDLEKEFMKERLYKGMYSWWKRYGGETKQTMVFSVGKKHNLESMEFFKKMGVSCAAVDDDTPWAERKRIVDKFREGPFAKDPLMAVFSIGVFVEGFDNKWVKMVIENFASQSLTKIFQAAPRGSRPVWNEDFTDWLKIDGKYYKEEILILDFGGNHTRTTTPEMYDVFGFDITCKKKKGEAPTKVCGECRTIVYASYKKCPHCGHEFPLEEKKDDKKFSDEVNMVEIKKDQHWQKLILNMPQDRIWNANPGYLRVIALVKGYQPTWCYHVLKDRGEIDWHDGTPEAWARFYKWIAIQEKEKGMSAVLERMRQNQIKK